MENRIARQIFFVAAMVGVPSLSMAQETVPAVAIGSPASIQAERLTSAQLSDLVAPVALYPDALLSQILVASTYPLEVVQAQQWLQRNDGLRGQALMDAAREQRWDASVQGLVAFPDALDTLNKDVQWTAALGNAFLAQEADVMTAVQRLRAQAQASGRLSSTQQQTVSAVAQEGRTIIEIVPADPQVIYVPQYDPYYVWGAPAWGAYPALGYGYGYGFGPAINVGFWFGGWSWGWGWGWGPNWYGGSVYVNSAFFRHCGYNYGHHGAYYGGSHGGHGGGYNGGHNGGNNGGHNGRNQAGGSGGRETWQHDAGHRMGVPYSSSQVARRYNAASQAARATMAGPGAWNRSGSVTTSPSESRTLNSGSRSGGADRGWSAGNRTMPSGSRASGTDQTWRSGNRTAGTSPRSSGVDQAWRALADQGRRSRGVTQSQGPSARSSASSSRNSVSAPRYSAAEPRSSAYSPRSSDSSSRYSASSPRSSAASPRYAAPSRSTSAPSQGYSAPSRSTSAPSRSYSAPSRSYSSAGPMRGAQAAPRSSSSSGAGRSYGGGGSQASGGSSSSRGSAGGRSSGGGSQGGGGRRH